MKQQEMVKMKRLGAFSGVLSVTSYLIIVFTSLPDQIVFLLAMFFPMFGIVFLFVLREWIRAERVSYVNELAFVFGSFAFCICAIFLSAQLAVEIGVKVPFRDVPPSLGNQVKEAVRMVDMGMDVAWDMFIGVYLVLFGAATLRIPILRFWGITAAVFGLLLIILNVYTFPVPPGDAGLLDVGPFIGLFLLALSFRLLLSQSAQPRKVDNQ
ncbi:hypothetical protein [Dyadobacter sandarakinus]|uniref:DUF4386 domain-containing protein n=1 Tax=Dyadobacter sandarakinus TaxID=2747268 RepID=A0ABX7I196_9BACT|nr:hypothetical protein [Dyadobacter sandarakinus]QRQ99548.1 hypothetical protein HWI92_00775 [Dyadobacter sandarakinus]